jgi:hypothetical protein
VNFMSLDVRQPTLVPCCAVWAGVACVVLHRVADVVGGSSLHRGVNTPVDLVCTQESSDADHRSLVSERDSLQRQLSECVDMAVAASPRAHRL